MIHSFISPRPKNILSDEIRLALFFFSITIGMLVVTYAFLLFKTVQFTQEHHSFESNIGTLKKEEAREVLAISIIEAQAKLGEQTLTNNIVIKESIHNLFDLVPDSITLTRMELDRKSLILYGVTPNKDSYEFMLHAPLRSIFHQTYSSFYPLDNGWYNFVSTNYLEEEAQSKVTP